MNRALSYTATLFMLAGLSLPIAAQVPPTLILPGGALNQTSTPGVTVVVAADTKTFFQITATFKSIPSGYAISNRVYNGWCVDPFSDFANNPPYQLISTYDATTLANPPGGGRAQNPNWNKVNWVLNNKPTGTTNTWVVQQVIWKLLTGQYIATAPDGGPYPNPALGSFTSSDATIANTLYAAANMQGSFVPGPGQVAGVMLYLDGINPDGTTAASNLVVTSNGINPLAPPLNGLNGQANQLQEILVEVPVPTGAIGDFIWQDTNHNGIQDAGEPGINGVTVKLFNSGGTLVATTVTATNGIAQGYYQFTGLPDATYTVVVDTTSSPLTGLVASQSTVGNNTAIDSDGSPATVTITGGSVNETIDFGFQTTCTGQIGDFVWNDYNQNGIQNSGEPGIPSVTVNLFDSTGSTLLKTTTTNGSGNYNFTGVCSGSYTVRVDATTLPTGFTAAPTNASGSTTANDSNGSPAPVTLATDSSTDFTVDFGYLQPCTGQLGFFVWHDLNRNGLQDAGEPGINGVTVALTDSQGHAVASPLPTFSNGAINGYYQFSGVCAGTYTVTVTGGVPTTLINATPVAWTLTTADVGTDNTVNSRTNPTNVTLTQPNSTNETINFGYQSPCDGTIGYLVWNDANQNGLFDAGEAGIGGVIVNLRNPADNTLIQTTTTDASGAYHFYGRCAGSYKVEVVPPAGYTPDTVTPATPGANVGSPFTFTLPNDTDDENVNFGYFQTGTLTANVFLDSNDNAAKDTGETGLTGWTVTVTGTNGITFTQTQQTDSNGNITPITGLVPGAYSVCVTAQSGYTETTPAPLNNCYTVTVPANGTGSATFGYFQPGGLIANVFLDANDNASKDAGETGLQNWSVTVTGTNGITFTQTQPTDASGNITPLTGLIPGVYNVCVTPQAGYTETTPGPLNNCFSVTVPAGGTGSATFGYYQPGTLNTNVFLDSNADTTQDNGETGLPNWTITVTGTGGITYTSVNTTGPAGSIPQITGLLAGAYQVCLTLQTGYTQTTPLPVTSQCVNVVVPAGGNGSATFGVVLPVTIACSSTNSGEVGAAFNSPAPTVSGGTAPYTFSLAPGNTLPAGLTLDASTGAITGTPTAAGTFTLQVKDSKGVIAATTCPYTIIAAPTLACSAVTSGEVGQPFNSPAPVTTGGATPLTFSIATGALPAGLTLNAATGAVTGTPSAAGTFTVQVTDAKGVVAATTCPYTIIAAPTLACSAVTSGEVGQPFNSPALVTTGGATPLTFSIATGALPAGLTLNAATGAITGTPSAAGNFTIKVTDANGVVATTTCPFTIVAAPTLACSGTSAGEVGQPFNSPAMTVYGGSGSYTFSVATGALPTGLTLNASTGAITGTPVSFGNFTIKVTDANGVVATSTCPFAIAPAPTVTCSLTNTGEVGLAFNSPGIGVTGSTGPYTYSIATGALPTGLTLNTSTGAITGTATVAGAFTIKVTDANGVTVNSTCPFTITTGPSVSCAASSATVGKTYSSAFAAGGGTAPYTYSISSGSLPPGLILNSATGAITGTPTKAGTYPYSIKAVDGNGAVTYSSCSIVVAPSPIDLECGSCGTTGKATVGTPYKSNLAVTGGTGPYTYSIIQGSLPSGLALNSSTGAVSGTPTIPGTYTFTSEVTDANGNTDTAICTIVVQAAPIDLECGTCAAGKATVGASYSAALAVTGGVGPYTYSITYGSLPPGLTLNASTGVVSGTPTTPGTYTFTSKVVDSQGNWDTTTCSITVVGSPINLTCGSCGSNSTSVGASYSAALSVTGARAPYTYSIVSGSLPPGLTLNSSTGVISGSPTTSGSYTFTSKVVDANGNSDTATCTINVQAPPIDLSCGTCGASSGKVGSPYSALYARAGGKAPFTYSIASGSLPPGLSLNASTGAVTGTPTMAGSFTFSAKVLDANGSSDTATCTIVITGSSLNLDCGTCGASKATVGVSYSATYAVSGGTGSFTYSIVSGSLPPGLKLSGATISGNPTTPGSYTFTAKVTDSKGNTDTQSCTVVVIAAPIDIECGSCGTGNANTGVAYSATFAVTGATGSVSFSIVSGSLPTGMTLNAATGTISGSPTTAGTYTFTAKVVDSKGNYDTTTCTITVLSSVLDIQCGTCGATKAMVGTGYSASFAATGGAPSYTYSISSGSLPAGLTLNASTGALSGTPTASGTFTFTSKVTDSKGKTDTVTCTLVVQPSPITLNCGSCSAGKAQTGSPFSASLSATGGTGALTYSIVSGSLPPGLTLNTSTGAISGTPTTGGTYTYTAKVVDSKGSSDTSTCTIVVNAPPVNLACGTCGASKATTGSAYSATLQVTGGSGKETYSIASGSLPPGVTLNASTGVIAGSPTTAGTYTFTSKALDANGTSDTATCTIVVSKSSGAGSYATYTQTEWGASPSGSTAGALLASKFSSAYSGGSVSVGGSHKLTFTTAVSIQNFLPQGGWPGMLSASATNPTSYTPAGVLAGEVLALQLNVDFSNKGITASGLGNLQVAYGPLKGQTVAQVLTMANAVLGGSSSVLPYGVSISDLNSVVDSINNNFDSGNTNNGFLK